MNVLFVSENYFPYVSGVPVVVKYLAEGLVNRGHLVTIVTKSNGNIKKEEYLNDVRVIRFDLYENFLKIPKGQVKEYRDFIINFQADATIIECTQCVTTDLLLPFLNQIKGRLYFHVHGISGLTSSRKMLAIKDNVRHTFGNTYNYFRGLYYFHHTLKKAMPLFCATMCLSEIDDGIDYLKCYSRKNYILDNAADNMFFEPELYTKEVLPKYAQLENECFMMSCANYSYIKNQLGIIDQYYQSESSRRMSLVCIGSQVNDYYRECIKHIDRLEKEYGHRDVILLHGVDRKDIPAIVNKATLYLVGSFWEQYSISIIESMSQGVPFVSTNVGNARILPGGVTIDGIEDMHKAIDHLLTDSNDYSHYSEAGRKFAYDNCRIDVAVDKLEKIISEK